MNVSELIATIRYIGLLKASRLTTLRLFYDYFIGETTTIPEAVTTISAGTLRLLLTSISYRAKARKELRRKPPMVPRRPPRPLPLDCPAGWRVPDRKPPGVESIETPAGLAWSAICCTVWRGSITGAHPYIPYYNRAAVLTCAASGAALVSGTRWRFCGAVMCSSVSQVVL